MFKVGEYVTRNKYNNDVIFKIIKIKNNIVYLKGAEVRLLASADISDLRTCKYCKKKESKNLLRSVDNKKYFYLPGSILHIDTDNEYLIQCREYYQNQKVKNDCITLKIDEYEYKIIDLIEKYNPNIIVITGHDAYYKNKNEYLYSKYYVNTVKKIRKKCMNNNMPIIIAGACQSDYEKLILAGSTFASSPTHSNVHCLDPAIIAVNIAYLDNKEQVDLEKVLNETKYGINGYGGIFINGVMRSGYPRKDKN